MSDIKRTVADTQGVPKKFIGANNEICYRIDRFCPDKRTDSGEIWVYALSEHGERITNPGYRVNRVIFEGQL